MTEVIRFKARAELEAEANLRSFIELSRNQLSAFGSRLPFDDNVWDVSDSVRGVGKSGQRRISFSISRSRPGRCQAFQEPYLSFAKAYMRHEFAHRGKSFIERGISTLRVLYRAMTEHGPATNSTTFTIEAFDRSVQTLNGLSPFRAYQIAQELEKLAAFLVNNHLVTAPLEWKSPLRASVSYSARVGKAFDDLRANRLPSPEALAALAHIFRRAVEPGDVLVSCVMAILCAAPSRIREVFSLPADCEVVRNDTKGTPVYSLRWYPSKGAPPQMKPVITSMVDVVKEAVDRIRALTKPGRAVAAWYECHPTELYAAPARAPAQPAYSGC